MAGDHSPAVDRVVCAASIREIKSSVGLASRRSTRRICNCAAPPSREARLQTLTPGDRREADVLGKVEQKGKGWLKLEGVESKPFSSASEISLCLRFSLPLRASLPPLDHSNPALLYESFSFRSSSFFLYCLHLNARFLCQAPYTRWDLT